MPSSLTDLPVELLLDNLLPIVPLSDLGNLAATNRTLAVVCADDTFWRRKCQIDFNFTSSETARTSGWRTLYRGLFRPRIFVWGERANGRLGVESVPSQAGGGVPYPIEVKIPGRRIVSLVAGGMSFNALDSNGMMYVWGTLNGEGHAWTTDGFAERYKTAKVPHQLVLPLPIRTISCGRLHTLAMDAKHQVWTFCNWGRPFKLVSPLVDCHAPDTTPVQVEAGWGFSSILTQAGDVLVYWQSSGIMGRRVHEKMEQLNEQEETKAHATEEHKIPCWTWDLEEDPFRLPAIPELPHLPNTGLSEEKLKEQTKLIKIASFDNNLIGLTNKGHLLKYYGLDNENMFTGARWEYLSKFSDVAELARHPVFNDDDNPSEAPKTMHITHITAHFQTFVAYSTGASSIVLVGNMDTGPLSDPDVPSSLQNRSVISVVLGDYHKGALTSSGKLLTWGAFSEGALGLGDPRKLPLGTPGGYRSQQALDSARRRDHIPEPPSVEEPAEVRFDMDGREAGRKYAFAATAGGWHSGALVLSLEVRLVYIPECSSSDSLSVNLYRSAAGKG
ncbi:RCC1/BLIP-II [Vararia minispora EC-137]|uniref:RCC1/BLIP-II n=1 Tax=Vararia minispora EC-137 TaxID=1314806 RepID=A0ACB8QBB1_9AGAM|nr:RCC1/BLIP-II [Vararia minispora EC-137]